MAKLYFQYSTMNAGKSTLLLQASHNYQERGMETYLITARFDKRAGDGKIGSRIGISSDGDTFDNQENMFQKIESRLKKGPCSCVFIDEAQFLTEEQVWQLARAVDGKRDHVDRPAGRRGDDRRGDRLDAGARQQERQARQGRLVRRLLPAGVRLRRDGGQPRAAQGPARIVRRFRRGRQRLHRLPGFRRRQRKPGGQEDAAHCTSDCTAGGASAGIGTRQK